MPEKTVRTECDVLVIGGGAAGCTAALAAHDAGARVVLLDKGTFSHSGMSGTLPYWYYAVPVDESDEKAMLKDAVKAGEGLADVKALELVAARSRTWADSLEEWGAIFNRDMSGGPQLVKSDGHSQPRTRWPACMWMLSNQLRRAEIEIRDEMSVLGLITSKDGACGAVALRRRDSAVEAHAAKCVVLATGGGGAMFGGDMRVWQSSAPAECTGEGYAMALDAGAELVDMEFIQTVMQPVATDAEGDGLLGDLVVRARRERLQVTLEQAPAAHHFLGGIRVNPDGSTTVPGLYACGDVTGGLYGAGRPEAMALPACMVWGEAAGGAAASAARERENAAPAIADERTRVCEKLVSDSLSADGDGPRPRQLRRELADAMVSALLSPPDENRLEASLAAVISLESQLAGVRLLDRSLTFNQELAERMELDNILTVAECVLRSALLRRESRGVFKRMDYPESDDDFLGHTCARLSGDKLEVEFEHL